MSVTLQDHLTILDDFRKDTSSDTVDPNAEGLRAINFIIRDIRKRHAWEFVLKKYSINYFQDVREVALPSNFQEISGLFEQMNFLDPFDRVSPVEFERRMNRSSAENLLAIDTTTGVKTIKVNFVTSKSRSIVVNGNVSVDGNGTWTPTGTASNAVTDTVVFFDSSGCVKFKLTGSGSGVLTNSGMTSVDLSTFLSNYTNFMKIFISDATKLTNIKLRWGNDASNYHEVTVTAQFNGLPFQTGLNLIGFDIASASDTGTISESAFDYGVLTFTHTGTIAVVQISEWTAKTPDPLLLAYYTDDFVYDVSATAWVSKFDADAAPTDYGAWSGVYDWFANVIELGAVWQVLLEMGETDVAEAYRVRYEGKDPEIKIGGALGDAIKMLPARVKKRNAPQLVPSFGGSGSADYYGP